MCFERWKKHDGTSGISPLIKVLRVEVLESCGKAPGAFEKKWQYLQIWTSSLS